MNDLTCDIAREQMALELYGELDFLDHARLAEHLSACGACRAARAALHAGLGQLVDPDEARDVGVRALGRRRPAWVSGVVGFAAGVLVTGLFAALVRGIPEPASGVADTSVALAAFRRELPPPPAVSSGRLAEIGAWMRD